MGRVQGGGKQDGDNLRGKSSTTSQKILLVLCQTRGAIVFVEDGHAVGE